MRTRLLVFIFLFLMISYVLSQGNRKVRSKAQNTKTKQTDKKSSDEKAHKETKNSNDKKRVKKEQFESDNNSEADSSRKSKKNRPTSFPYEASKVIELYKNNTDLLYKHDSRTLLFIYSSYNTVNQKLNTAINALSLMDDKVAKTITYYRAQAKQVYHVVEHYSIMEFPCIYLFVNDQEMVYPYEGDANAENILKFLHTMIRIQIHEVKTPEDLDKVKKVGSNLLIIGDAQKYKKEFNIIAKYSKKHFKHTMWSKNPELFQRFGIDQDSFDAIAFFTVNRKLNSGEKLNLDPNGISKYSISKISEVFSRRSYALLTHYKLETMIRQNLKSVMIFYNNQEKEARLEDDLIALSKEYRNDYWFLWGTNTRISSQIILENLNINLKNLDNFPLIMIVDNIKTNKRDFDLYVMDPNTLKSKLNIKTFIEEHRAGHLVREIMSDKPISPREKKLIEQERKEHATYNDTSHFKKSQHNYLINHSIGTTFNSDMFDHAGYDVIMWIASDSANCLKFTRRFKRAFKKLLTNKKILWNRINYQTNELPGIDNLQTVPALYIVPDILVNKEKKAIRFEGVFTTDNVVSFIVKNAVNPIDITTLPNEEEFKKKEELKEINPLYINDDEQVVEMYAGRPLGKGITTSLKRFLKMYEDRKDVEKEEISVEDHDNEEYDFDEENIYNGIHLKDDL